MNQPGQNMGQIGNFGSKASASGFAGSEHKAVLAMIPGASMDESAEMHADYTLIQTYSTWMMTGDHKHVCKFRVLFGDS